DAGAFVTSSPKTPRHQRLARSPGPSGAGAPARGALRAAAARRVLYDAAVTYVRGRVLAFAFLLAVVTYLDRICISVAAPAIRAELLLSLLQMGVVFSAFTLAYSVFEVPSGWLGDVSGARRVLTRIVLWWSAFTMLTGAARGFRSIVAIRFLFGAGEAG